MWSNFLAREKSNNCTFYHVDEMANYHPITIVQKIYLTDFALLSQNPKIQYLLEAPYDYVLYEFYDPIYEIIFAPNPEIRYQQHRDRNPEIHEKVRQVVNEEESLLQPLHEQSKRDRYGYIIGGSHIIWYRVGRNHQLKHYDLRKPAALRHKLINFYSDNQSHQIILTTQLRKKTLKTKEKYENIISDWLDWVKNFDKIEYIGEINYQDNNANLDIIFKEGFDDFLVILTIMLNAKLGTNLIEKLWIH
ncbi:hypothetical protein H6G80_30785 [Nostoc sp. FACHB-87]|uniref:hypothetical protein n=1 Tax=Nostocaceae TaxID=1162 RepID=UPI001688CA87|nr:MULTISPECIES: hypothetical protein [Nostocaceae]MBD2458440.1 hypothetical protein [Nostoc sp. FACHB-87]MBD2478896.1 hypothetical protein [Anabaena sp. FACHB-83]